MAGGSGIQKQCTGCLQVKTLDGFYTNRGRSTAKCKECVRKLSSDHYMANRDRINTARHELYNPTSARNGQLWANYRITPVQYQNLLNEQHGRCFLCGKLHEEAPRRRLVPDHDHRTGEIRALLCTTCNSGIGMLQDSPELCLKAATYLEKHHGRR